MELIKDRVMEVLASVIEPTMGFNIVDLGIVGDVLIEGNALGVDLILPPSDEANAGTLATEVEQRLLEAFDEMKVEVGIALEPQWSLDRATQEVRSRLETRT